MWAGVGGHPSISTWLCARRRVHVAHRCKLDVTVASDDPAARLGQGAQAGLLKIKNWTYIRDRGYRVPGLWPGCTSSSFAVSLPEPQRWYVPTACAARAAEAYKTVPRRLLGLEGQIRSTSWQHQLTTRTLPPGRIHSCAPSLTSRTFVRRMPGFNW